MEQGYSMVDDEPRKIPQKEENKRIQKVAVKKVPVPNKNRAVGNTILHSLACDMPEGAEKKRRHWKQLIILIELHCIVCNPKPQDQVLC